MSHVCDGRDLACLGCAGIAERHALLRSALTAADQLDDITRARIWTGIEDRLVDAPRPRRWPLAVGFAAIAAAAGVIALATRSPRDDDRHTLRVPVDTTVSSRLGPHTNAALIGPAELDLIGAPGPATTVRLRRGTLLAEFAGGPGRALRIETPRAVVEVVGTLFAVEVRGAVTCTSVVHGRVRVTATAVMEVGAGERYCTGDARVRPIADDTRDVLERHQATITAAAEPHEPTSRAPTEPAASVHGSPAAAESLPRLAPTAPLVSAAPAASVHGSPAAAVALPPLASTAPAAALRSPAPTAPTAPAVPVRGSVAPAPSAPPGGSPSRSPSPPVAAASPGPRTPPRAVTPIVPEDPDRHQRAAAGARTTADPDASPATPRMAPVTSLPPSTEPPRPTADELYRAAEAALAARDPRTAERVLATLVADHPASPLVDQALYERARIAYQQRSWAVARRHLDRLAAIANTPLAEPGRYLTCRIAVETRDDGADRCLVDYRARFPRSPHDLEALALLAQHAHAAGGCAAATALVGELARSYPRTTLAAAWRARCPEHP